MFWADRIADDIEKKYAKHIKAGEPLILRDEKTPSGRVHVGSMRGVAIHGVVSEALTERGIANEFKYEFNDMDPMDGLPAYLDASEFEQHMGKPLFAVPSPEPEVAENFADYYAAQFQQVIEETGFTPTFYRSSELYRSGQMNEVIRTALEHAADIRRIYKEVSGSEKPDDWFPLHVICENCGKVGTTQVTGFDGEQVRYTCKPDLVEWASGCGHEGNISPFDGNATMPFKVEWPAKFKVVGVDIEGAGKDHSTKGGTRDVANHICREVFDYAPPYDIPYEFFLVGGKKMSASKGTGSSAREIADLVPPHIFRLALLSKDIKQAFNFEPEGDTIPVLFDQYDKYAGLYWGGTRDDFTRLFELAHLPSERGDIVERFLPRFSQVAFLVQMPHMDIQEEVAKMKNAALTENDKKELDERARYARHWLDTYAPEAYRFELQDTLPEAARDLSDEQKAALSKLREHIESLEALDGQELHTALHDIRKELDIEPKAFFSAIYLVFLGKDHGPKAGWFLSVLDKEFLLRRLREVIG